MIKRCLQRGYTSIALLFLVPSCGVYSMQRARLFDDADRCKLAANQELVADGLAALKSIEEKKFDSLPVLANHVERACNSFMLILRNSLYVGYDLEKKGYFTRPIAAFKTECAQAAYGLAKLCRYRLLVPRYDTNGTYEAHYLQLAADCSHEPAFWDLYCAKHYDENRKRDGADDERKQFFEAYQWLQTAEQSLNNLEALCQAYGTMINFYKKVDRATHIYDSMVKRSQDLVWEVVTKYIAVHGIDKAVLLASYSGFVTLLENLSLNNNATACSLYGIYLVKRGDWKKGREVLETIVDQSLANKVHLLYCLLLDPQELHARSSKMFNLFITDRTSLDYFVQHCPERLNKRLQDESKKKDPFFSAVYGRLIFYKSPKQAFRVIKSAVDQRHLGACSMLAEMYALGHGVNKSIETALHYYGEILSYPQLPEEEVCQCLDCVYSLAKGSIETRAKVIMSLIQIPHRAQIAQRLLSCCDGLKESDMVALMIYLNNNYRYQLEKEANSGNVLADLLLSYVVLGETNCNVNRSEVAHIMNVGLEHSKKAFDEGLLLPPYRAEQLWAAGLVFKGLHDSKVARSCFAAAAGLGHKDALREIAIADLDNPTISGERAQEAFELIEKSALGGEKSDIEFLTKVYGVGVQFNNKLIVKKNPTKACFYLEKLLSLDPENKKVGYLLAKVLYSHKKELGIQIDNARVYKLLLAGMNDASASLEEDYASLGVLSYRLGNDAQALAWFDKAKKLLETGWHRALIYFRDERMSKAETEQECLQQIMIELQNGLAMVKAELKFPNPKDQPLWYPIIEAIGKRAHQMKDPRACALLPRFALFFSPEAAGYATMEDSIPDLRIAAANDPFAKNFLAFLNEVGTAVPASLPTATHYLTDVLMHHHDNSIAMQEATHSLMRIIKALSPCNDHNEAVNIIKEIYETIFVLLKSENSEQQAIAFTLFGEIEVIIPKFLQDESVIACCNNSGVLQALYKTAHEGSLKAAAALAMYQGHRFVKMVGSLQDLDAAITLCESTENKCRRGRADGSGFSLQEKKILFNAVSLVIQTFIHDSDIKAKHASRESIPSKLQRLLKLAQRYASDEESKQEFQCFQARQNIYVQKSCKKSLEHLILLARDSFTTAHLYLSEIYLPGMPNCCDVPKNIGLGFVYLGGAVLSGNIKALHLLTKLYLENKDNQPIKVAITRCIDLQLLSGLALEDETKLFLRGLQALIKGDYSVARSLFDEHYKKYHVMISGLLCAYIHMINPEHEYERMHKYLQEMVAQRGFLDWLAAAPLCTFVFQRAKKSLTIASNLQNEKARELLPKVEALFAEQQAFWDKNFYLP